MSIGLNGQFLGRREEEIWFGNHKVLSLIFVEDVVLFMFGPRPSAVTRKVHSRV